MISWERVNELREEVGQEDFLEVVDIFLEEVDEVAGRLKASPSPATLEDEMHFLKGSAMNLGFKALADICQMGERDAAQHKYELVDLHAVLAVYAQSRAEFNGGAGVDKIAV